MNCCSVSLLKAEFDFSANENYSWKWLCMKERLHCSHGLVKGLYTHKFQYWNVTEIETDTHSHWIIYVSGSTSDGATNSLSPFWFSIRICNWARISHKIQSNAKAKRRNEQKIKYKTNHSVFHLSFAFAAQKVSRSFVWLSWSFFLFIIHIPQP